MFPIYTVPDGAADLPEQLGTKPKFWFQHEEFGDALFKEGRPNTGDDWSEKVASELCNLLNLPHATYHLAIWRGRRGVISPKFVPPGGALIHGNLPMARVVPSYPGSKFFHVHQHTLRRVLAIMRSDQIKLPLGWQGFTGVESAIDVFVGYLMLDAWIANQDRHHENWSFVVTRDRAVHLAPSYDHASSLAANETDENREDRLRTRDEGRSVERYVQRASSAFYPSPSPSANPMSTIEAFREAGAVRPHAARAWLKRLEQVPAEDTEQIFDQVPAERISPLAVEFAHKMLEINRKRLLALRGATK